MKLLHCFMALQNIDGCMWTVCILAHLSRGLRGELIVYQSSKRPSVRAHEKTLVEYTWNSVHRLPHTLPSSKFLRFIVNKKHNGIKLICIFKGNYKR